ncbi:MAG: cob(I)yrinic acid a,c-diamide adenosyltransferase [Thermodesulfobacteriota bacterium]
MTPPTQATEDAGLTILFTGDGKGKTTAAFGQALRAAGQGLAVSIVQFLKGPWPTGEEKACAAIPGITLQRCGAGFTWQGPDLAIHRQAAMAGWEMACRQMAEDRFDLLILDELTHLIALEFVSEVQILDGIRCRPRRLHLVITGRGATPALLAACDLVTEMRAIRHPFARGLPARKGIEY